MALIGRGAVDRPTNVRYLRAYVRQLRKKIAPNPNEPQDNTTKTRVGYRLREADLDRPASAQPSAPNDQIGSSNLVEVPEVASPADVPIGVSVCSNAKLLPYLPGKAADSLGVYAMSSG